MDRRKGTITGSACWATGSTDEHVTARTAVPARFKWSQIFRNSIKVAQFIMLLGMFKNSKQEPFFKSLNTVGNGALFSSTPWYYKGDEQL